MVQMPKSQPPGSDADHDPSRPVAAQSTSLFGRKLIAVFFAALFCASIIQRGLRDPSEMQITFGAFQAMAGLVMVIFRHRLGRWQLRRWRLWGSGFWTYMGDVGASLIYLGTGVAFIAGGLTLLVTGLIG